MGPAGQRLKRYVADSGYVYEYFHDGNRAAKELIFTYSADRKRWRELRVAVPERSSLNTNERYAVAKLALFEAFDEAGTPAALDARIEVDDAQVERILVRLGLV